MKGGDCSLKIGLIDMGSNTIRLCVYEAENGRFERTYDQKIMAKLGSCVECGELTREGIGRAVDAVSELRRAYTEPLDVLQAFATASLRNVTNGGEAAAYIESETGLPIRLISGEEEALLSMEGARLGGAMPPSGCMIDIGGGSTELAVYEDGEAQTVLSLPIGSLNLRKDWVIGERPTAGEGRVLAGIVSEHLPRLEGLPACPVMVGVGGTVRTAVKVANLVLETGDGKMLTRSDASGLLALLLKGDEAAVIAVEQAAPDRSRTLPTGLMILTTIMETLKAEQVRASKYGVREGFLSKHFLNQS